MRKQLVSITLLGMFFGSALAGLLSTMSQDEAVEPPPAPVIIQAPAQQPTQPPPAPVPSPPPPPPPSTQAPPQAPPSQGPLEIPPCEHEDSDDCIWNAAERGNGEGMSFIAYHGERYYLEGSWTGP